MVDITSISHWTSSNMLYDIHRIARSDLRLIGENHRIVAHDEKTSTSHGPSIRPPTSSTVVRMQPIRGQGRGRGGGRGHSRPGKRGGGGPGKRSGGRPSGSTYENSIPAPETFIPHEYSTPPS